VAEAGSSDHAAHEQPLGKRLFPIALTRTAGNFNDNAFKMVVTFVAVANEEDPGRRNAIIALGSMLFMLPYLVFPTVSGWVGDRFNKRKVLIAGKFGELGVMIYATVCFCMVAEWGWVPLLVGVSLMALQSTFFTPAFLGILPETFDERDLPNVNGILELFGFLGIILGTGSAVIYHEIPEKWVGFLGLYFILLAVIGIYGAWKTEDTHSPTISQRPGLHFITDYVRNMRFTWQTREIFLCIVGHATVMSVGMLLLTSLVSFVPDDLGFSKAWVSILQVGGAVGIGLGSFLAGKLSDHKAEFGLVPIGASMLTFFLILLYLCPTIPAGHEGLHWAHWYATISITCTGLGSGIFSLPFMVYLQDRTPVRVRGKTLAMMNALTFLAMFLVSLAMFIMTGGTAEPIANPDWLDSLRTSCFQYSIRDLYLWAAAVLVVATTTAFYLLPDFLCRFILVLATRTVYRMRVFGRDQVPHEGGALLLANHVTYVDGFLVGAATSRYVHFVVDESFADHPLVRPFRRWAGIVKMPMGEGPKALARGVKEVQALLRKGEVVCMFPEGKATGNGAIGEFKRGYQLMLPKGCETPVIPVNLGLMWGSVFSRGRRRSWRIRAARPVTVSFGEKLPSNATPFDARQAVSLLSSDAMSERGYGEHRLPDHYLRVGSRRRGEPLFADSGGEWRSNAQVMTRALALSRKLSELPGPHVGIVLPPCSGAVISALACYLANKIPVFLNFTSTAEAQQYAIEQCGIQRIVTSRKFVEQAKLPEREMYLYLDELAGAIDRSDRLYALRGLMMPRVSRLPEREKRDVAATATVLFSSGSTGTPKGIELTHHNLNTNAFTVSQVVHLEREDILLGALPMFHSFGFLATLWLPLTLGVRVMYHPNPRDAQRIGEIVQQAKCTILFATPTILQLYIRKCTPEQFASLRLVITGAERLRPAVAAAFAEKFGVVPIEGYGATELSPVVSVNMPADVSQLGQACGKPDSVGQPLHGVSVRTVSTEDGRILGADEEGLLLVKGPNVMKGYLNAPERTASVLKDGWYETGDLARIDQAGYIFITGRLSRFSKVGGEMIPHGALEDEMHDVLRIDDRQVVVVTGVPDSARGERLIVLHLSLEQSPTEIVSALREREFPNYSIPKVADFYEITEIPVLGTGKLDLAAIIVIAIERTQGD